MTKRISFDRNPVDNLARQELRERVFRFVGEYEFRVPLRKRNRNGLSYWDVQWRATVVETADDLGFDYILVNSSLMLRFEPDRSKLMSAASARYKELEDRRCARS